MSTRTSVPSVMPAASRTQSLDRRGIVITRPRDQAQVLAELIESRGGRALLFPVIDIVEVSEREPLDALIDRLETFDFAIFISPNAANRGMAAVTARRAWPRNVQVIAIGGGTARVLRTLGMDSVIAPHQRFDSESLLELPALSDVAQKRIVIFRGVGGRQLLGDTLAARGAAVEFAECYRRIKPAADTASLLEAWRRGDIDALVATSSEGVRNLYEMLDASGRDELARTALFVPHPRIAATAHALGLTRVFLTDAGDEGIAAGIARHFSGASR